MVRTKETNPVARKAHICSYCGETINKGELYLKIEETCIKEEDIDFSYNIYKICPKCIKEAELEQIEMQKEQKEKEKECELKGHNFVEDMVYRYCSTYGIYEPDYSNGYFCTNCGIEDK